MQAGRSHLGLGRPALGPPMCSLPLPLQSLSPEVRFSLPPTGHAGDTTACLFLPFSGHTTLLNQGQFEACFISLFLLRLGEVEIAAFVFTHG